MAGVALLVLAAALAVLLGLVHPGTTHSSASRSSRADRHVRPTTTAIARSPAGLALGTPPLRLDLSGVDDPVRASFLQPPRAGLLIDLNSGRVLWQLNPLQRLHMASLTKLMTALRVVRSTPTNAPVLITREAIDMPGSKVGLLPLGRHVSADTLLYGLLLPSGNDAAVALAQHSAGNVSAFVDGMNSEAARLGLGCTHYSSPSGYYDARNYTCAADLAELAYVDLHQPRIARVVRTAEAALPFPIKGGKLYLSNNNPLLVYGYPGTTGMKTGYTELAGDCLVASAERDGVSLGVVLLHSPDMGQQAEYLLNAGFAEVYHQRLIASPQVPPGR